MSARTLDEAETLITYLREGVLDRMQEISRLTRERDEAVAQRDALAETLRYAVSVLRAFDRADTYMHERPEALAKARAFLARLDVTVPTAHKRVLNRED